MKDRAKTTMDVPVGSLIVIDTIYNHSAVTPRVFKVIHETDKSVEITSLDAEGEPKNLDNTRTIRKTSIVAILNNLEEFEPFKKMNDDLAEKFRIYNEAYAQYEKEVKLIKARTHGK